MKLIYLRRFTQVLIIVILILSPISQIIRTYHQIPYPYTESPLIQNQEIKKLLDDNNLPIKNKISLVYDEINGGPYSLKFYTFKFEEPLTVIIYTFRNFFHSEFWNLIQIIALIISLGLAFFLGRVYCGYICPWSLIVSWNLKLQKRLFNRTPSYTASIETNSKKWKLIFYVLITFIVLFNPLTLQYILLPSVIQHVFSDYILFGSYSLWGFMLFLLLIIELMQPALICRSLCPTGIFLTYAGKLKVISLNFNKRMKCLKGCDLCNEVCWLGLQPKIKPVDSACDMCVRCTKVCPTNRLVIRKKRNILTKASMMIIGLIFISCTSKNAEYDYNDFLSDVFLYENSIKQIHNQDTLNVLYSFVGNKVTQQHGGVISMNLHMYKNNKTVNSSIRIVCKKDNLLTLDTVVNEVNYPISIITPSVYRIKFNMERNATFQFIVKSLNYEFQDVQFKFNYPNNRF